MERQLSTLCPACGAQVAFRSGHSTIAICAYCTSTLLREGDAIENLGRMAELFDDHSPLQIGARGVYEGVAFALIGRLQYRYDAGTWNEWRMLLDDGRECWLSEDNGQFVVTAPVGPQAVPAFDALVPGGTVALAGRSFVVASTASATVVAGEGELPFRVAGGYAAPVADLRDADGRFATLDYSDFVDASATPGTAMLYVGRGVGLDALGMSGLRDRLERTVATEQFACPSCGSPVKPTLATTQSLTCTACASVIDLHSGTGGRYAFATQARRYEPRLPIGMTGRLDGIEWTVTGFQRREAVVDDERFHWTEYLLHSPMHGFRFLVEDNGHWSFVENLQAMPTESRGRGGRRQVRLDGTIFAHFAGNTARVTYVEGEFYWRVRKDDETRNDDFIAPPRVLSREQSGSEVSWSLGRYLTPDALRAAFPQAKPMPRPTGIGMLQPAPPSQRGRYLKMTAAALGLLVAMQAWFVATGSTERVIAEQALDFRDTLPADTLIEVKGTRDANLIVQTEGAISNDWYEIDVELASRDRPGDVRTASREVAYYQGRDADGSWSEGSPRERVVFKVPPGRYLLRISGRRNPGSVVPNGAVWSVTQTTRPGWTLFWIGLGVLWVWNMVGVVGAPDPERLRWRDSDHAGPPPGFGKKTGG
ncbi:MAG: DUF4178 domain-containing protein [Lautropia sp.]